MAMDLEFEIDLITMLILPDSNYCVLFLSFHIVNSLIIPGRCK